MAINSILAAGVIGAPTPEPGMGATVLMHSDRHAYTVAMVEHFKSGSRKGLVSAVYAQRDTVQRVDSNGMSESQEHVFLPNAAAPYRKFTLRKNGRYVDAGGTVLAVGYRSEYYDFSY